MAQHRKICPFCNRPMVLKGELKHPTLRCNCIDESKCRNVQLKIEDDEFIYWQMYE
jgi:hypothetical protein